MWDRRDHGTSEMIHKPTTPKTSLHPEKVMLCTCWDWKGVLSYELILENQTINSNKWSSWLDQLKVALDKKHLNWSTENAWSYIRILQDCLFLCWPVRNCYSLAGKFWFICCIHQRLYLQISIYFDLYKFLLM